MLTEALFIIARIRKQPRCSSTEEWMKKNVVHLHNGVPLSRKKDTLKFACKWMELEKTILSEVTQTQKEKQGVYSFISGY